MGEATEKKGLPEFVSFGEALTDMIRVAPDQWKSVPGGAPWNVAMVMSYFGIPSAFGGAISSDCFGDEIWKTTIHAKLDYPCRTGLPAGVIADAAGALRSDPDMLRFLRLRIADTETRIFDLTRNNRSVMDNLRAIAGETP